MDQLDLLRLYVAIADHGSLSAVARAQALSPSTVTLGLQRLEERVGARLITRTTRRLSFTPEGERFLIDCRRILGDLDDVMTGLADSGQIEGEISVTATNDFGRSRLVPLIDAFMHAHPGVRVALMLTDAVLDLAEEGYDLGLRIGVLRETSMVSRLLVRDRRRICAAPSYWERMGRPAHPRDLAAHNCMALARPGAPMMSWRFQEKGAEFSVRISGDRSTNDGGALRNWAIGGAGVIKKVGLDIEEDLASGRLEAVLDAFAIAQTNLYAVHPPGRRPARRVIALVDYLAERLQNPAGNTG
ncbi:LysR family transcriptional regulator [Pseudochelatococcus contaminans]|uniref:DNA-binding transcriptional LysR family regulator n=1 Tax=Pseudochelatococcus contaminans TaxID=1538103 RepID=A0A7W6EF30_9HYPH|nr:LysR family transcriptional regulator [Pseudochelatococcus contaminans]MBB3808564.1 DNA-binding transcriptional LysR family regulator [Pseudochelatococcus contaminans]